MPWCWSLFSNKCGEKSSFQRDNAYHVFYNDGSKKRKPMEPEGRGQRKRAGEDRYGSI
ncbi:hypothetical protein IMSAG185_01770 [Lachnospiraceae bacterium]|nr:hypothetical protein IMSAG185_01770 [Lachnospiraceae bacterium]